MTATRYAIGLSGTIWLALACGDEGVAGRRNITIQGDPAGAAGDGDVEGGTGGGGGSVAHDAGTCCDASGAGGTSPGDTGAGRGGSGLRDGGEALGGTGNAAGSTGEAGEGSVGGAAGSPDPPDPPDPPGPLIDRFGSASSTLLSRAARSDLPAPGAPIDFDRPPFLVRALGPNGERVHCYHLDVQRAEPVPVYLPVFQEDGRLVLDQLPIVDAVPGDAGYSDLHRLVRIPVPEDYVTNSLKSVDDIIDSELALEPTDIVLNHAVVPAGSSAHLRAGTENPELLEAWYRGVVVHYLAFEEAELRLTEEELAPISLSYAAFRVNPAPENAGRNVDFDFLTDPATGATHNVLPVLPGMPGYSPLQTLVVYDNAAFDAVADLSTASAAPRVETDLGALNCPVVAFEEP